MKKVYGKPDIIFENFALSTNISAGCDYIITNQVLDVCGMNSGRNVIFINGVQGCSTVVEDNSEAENDGWCYHVPIETKHLFNS